MRHSSGVLLHHVRQLMRKQPPSTMTSRCKLPLIEDNIISHRVGAGVHVSRRLLSVRAGMYPHSGKIVAEPLLHVVPHRLIQRPAGGTQDVVNNRGSDSARRARR